MKREDVLKQLLAHIDEAMKNSDSVDREALRNIFCRVECLKQYGWVEETQPIQ